MRDTRDMQKILAALGSPIRREILEAVAEHHNELPMPAVLSSGEKIG